MTQRTAIVRTCLCLLALAALPPSCGGNSESTGTDSNTHWLEECDDDSDCGSLACVCGACSKPCDTAAACEGFGANAVCVVPTTCDEPSPPAVCDVQCTTGAECRFLGAAGVCRGGVCRVERSTPTDGECQAMDAAENGTNCGTIVGYAYNGQVCHEIWCGCIGADCGKLHPTMEACRSRARGVLRRSRCNA